MLSTAPRTRQQRQRELGRRLEDGAARTFDPLVAGALVNKIKQFGGVDHKLVQDLASIQKGYKRDIGSPVLSEVGKTVGEVITPNL